MPQNGKRIVLHCPWIPNCKTEIEDEATKKSIMMNWVQKELGEMKSHAGRAVLVTG